MESILDSITDESERLFVIGVLIVIVLAIALVIIIFISRIKFLKNQLFDAHMIDVEKDKEIFKLKDDYLVTESRNSALEKELQVLNDTKDALKYKKELMLKMQEKNILLEESRRQHILSAKAKSRDFQTLTFKYKSLQKRNEFLIGENREFRSENKKVILKIREQDRRIFEKLMMVQGNREEHRREIEILADKSFEKNQQLFDLLHDKSIWEDILSLSDEIEQYREKLVYGYEKRLSANTNLQNDIFGQVGLYKQIEEDVDVLLDIAKDENRLETLGEQIIGYILELSEIDQERIVQQDKVSIDVILPNHQNIMVDATFSLASYEKYRDMRDPVDREIALSHYMESFKNHIDLVNKSLSQEEYVLILIPIQEALEVALKHENNLYKQSAKRGLLLVSPMTLFVSLQNIALLWEYQHHYKQAGDIGMIAEEFYEKFSKVGKDISVVSQRLEMIQGSLPVKINKNRSV